MSQHTPMTHFLYPRARDHAFDEVCEKIVRALEQRHFKVPGLIVEFREYGHGGIRMRHVSRVTGKDFSIYFCRAQGYTPDHKCYDMAAVESIAIPKEKISVYSDHSGPVYIRYVGENWEADRPWFLHESCFINSKLYGEPRRYLKYWGSDEMHRRVSYMNGKTATYLVHGNDLDREYDLEDGDPQHLVTSEVAERIALHLEDELKKIEDTPSRADEFQFVNLDIIIG